MNLSDVELWNTIFPPFKAAVEAGAGNVMTAYMDLNGVPASASRWLFTEVLRQEWGFGGFVVSDANAVRNLVTHGFAEDLTDAAARAMTAGVDLEMAIQDPAYAHLPEALQAGAVSQDVLDASVRRILEAKLRLGLFDNPYVDEDRARQVLADPQHREVALVAAGAGGAGGRRAVSVSVMDAKETVDDFGPGVPVDPGTARTPTLEEVGERSIGGHGQPHRAAF
jgi:beta-glucosidase